MEPQVLLNSDPLYNFWITGNAATVPSRKQLKSLKIDKNIVDLMIESNFSPKVTATMIKGITFLILYGYQSLGKDSKNLLKELENPKLPSKKANRSKKVVKTRRTLAFQNQNNMFMYSDSYSEKGNKYRFPDNPTSFINNPSEITLPAQGHMGLYQHSRDAAEGFGFPGPFNDSDFPQAVNNFVPGNGAIGEQGNEGFLLGFDIRNFPQEEIGFNLPTSLKPDYLSSFTQKINKNFENFKMITPTKLNNDDLYDYYEEDRGSEEKNGVRINLSNKEQVARTLDFGGHRPRDFTRRKFFDIRQKKSSLQDLKKSLEEPFSDLSENLRELWMFAQGKSDCFEENLNNLKEKEELWIRFKNQYGVDEIEQQQNRDDGSAPHESTAKKISQSFSSKANSGFQKAPSLVISSGKKTGVYVDHQSSNSKYGTIQEDTHEMTSTTQLFGISESYPFNPPTISYEMSLGQYEKNQNAEEKKKNQARKSLQLTKEAKDVLTIMSEQSKFIKPLEFGYLTQTFTKEQKASYFYNTLVLAGVGKITMEQGLTEKFSEISIVLN